MMRLLRIAPALVGAVTAFHGHMDPRDTTTVATSTPTAATSTPTAIYFPTQWTLPSNITLGIEASIPFTNQANPSEIALSQVYMMLCQTSDHHNVNTETSWTVTPVLATCGGQTCYFNESENIDFTLYAQNSIVYNNPASLLDFFFCLGTTPDGNVDNFICDAFSDLFNIDAGSTTSSSPTPTVTSHARKLVKKDGQTIPQSTLSLTTNSPIIGTTSIDLATATSASSGIQITQSILPTTTVTTFPTSTSSSSSSSSSSKSSGLSLGAKIGIALGGLAFVLALLLLALLCLRRRHSKRSSTRSEQVMLTTANANDSRDLMAEKESFALQHRDTDATESYHMDPSPTESGAPVLPAQTRFSAIPTYDVESRPYTGSAAAIPRRKTPPQDPPPTSSPAPASASQPSALTRAVSEASQRLSRTLSGGNRNQNQTNLARSVSGVSSVSRASDRTIDVPAAEFEAYRDIPSHLFWGPTASTSFLDSETSRAVSTVSSDERARLEEEDEERRIDAAIAEAERRKRGALGS